jgi:alpha-amylase/alpha-mannosidase (GH57 family)
MFRRWSDLTGNTSLPTEGRRSLKMPSSNRYLCIHGHFYQPPRENPWLETVETQPTAAPYHDWNDRITAECYAPNGAARIVNPENEIIRIMNNYSRISFNFGPTLLSWLESEAPRVYRAILEADRASQQRFGGHGSAMAQAYNHMILPLASRRDKLTQILWGIADFQSRFGRAPEGMWLPETAVDTESLDLMAEQGLKFVVLAPSQCRRVRPLQSDDDALATDAAWEDTPHDSVLTTRAYRIKLPSGRSIAAFFYNGACSRAIAFEGLLNKGEYFYDRLMGAFDAKSEEPQLVHVATDGESYGHHHRYGDMALAWMLEHVEQTGDAHLTNYGEFLEKFPPVWEASIEENTSWSCAHGVERWRSNCGCNTHPGWSQQWRTPLREALDWLRDRVAAYAQRAALSMGFDLDRARNGYIQVILDRNRHPGDETSTAAAEFIAAFMPQARTPELRQAALKLMEMERHAQLMYTSCGWFFDEISGIETVQIIAYASRVLQLAAELFGPNAAELEDEFIQKLSTAQSNLPEEADGGQVYRKHILPMKVGLEQVAAHYAISSIFTSYPDDAAIFCYMVRREAYEMYNSGRARLIIGRGFVTSKVTEESEMVVFAVLHLGDHNLTAAVKRWNAALEPTYAPLCHALQAAMIRADIAEVIRVLDRQFAEASAGGEIQPTHTYSLTSLFQDEQRRILGLILTSTLNEVEASISAIYQTQASLLHFLSQSQLPKPQALLLAANFAVNAGLRHALESDPVDAVQVRAMLEVAESDKIELDRQELSYLAGTRMKKAMATLLEHMGSTEHLENALTLARILALFPFETRIWHAQNIWNEALQYTRVRKQTADWMKQFMELGRQLHICAECLWSDENSVAV